MIKIRPTYLKRALAGAIFGLYMAHLLYYLNPQIDITPGRLLLVTLAYGLICGFLLGTTLWLLRVLRVRLFGRPDEVEYRPHGFGYVVAAAFFSAAVYWAHLIFFKIYLPPGAVRILSKATTLIGATAFLLFVIWIIERNAGRTVSNILLGGAVLLIAISAFFLYQRRDRYHEDERALVVANVAVAESRPVVVLAVRSLPYDWLLTLSGEGNLPFFSRMQREAFVDRLEPFPSTSSKALWASLVTGKLPYRHGVTGRFSYKTPLTGPTDRFQILPSWVGFRAWGLIPPVTRISASLPSGDSLPVWAMFERIGVASAVIDWPSATPAGQQASAVVGETFLRDPAATTAITKTVNVEELRALIRSAGTPDTTIARRLQDLPQSQGDAIRTAIARDQAVVAITSDLLKGHRFGLAMATLNSLGDSLSALRSVSNTLPEASTTRGAMIRSVIGELDSLLGGLQKKLGAETTLVIVSPSGPVPPSLPATPIAALQEILRFEDIGANEGFVIISASGVLHRENPAPAHLIDVVPTILFTAGLPIARDFDGTVLTDAFREEVLSTRSMSFVPSYEAPRFVVRHQQIP
ncbi:MAG TPA: alkaline phosphatase family protein [Thermoanaerobaculia bacterium]|nr:alkaline phosphatase family protein [Thermoanaerobaculia bacterium]